MRSLNPSARHFDVRSERGALQAPLPAFTSGLMSVANGNTAAVSDDQVIAAALRILSGRIKGTVALANPRVIRDYIAVRFAGLEHEVFACLYLDVRHRVIACEELFRGTIDGAVVHGREVVKRALAHNAAAVILAHNHPSGVAEPSAADRKITQRLKEALNLVDIRVVDHLVVGGAVVESFLERGLL